MNAFSFHLLFTFETCSIAPSPQNVQGSTKSWPFFHWSGCHPVNFLIHPPKKNPIVIKKFFSVIKIDKQSLNHKFWGFILILSVSWGQLRTKCPCHTTFVYRSVTLFICFCGNTDVSLHGHHGSDSFILPVWTLFLCEVVKLMLTSTFHSTYIL